MMRERRVHSWPKPKQNYLDSVSMCTAEVAKVAAASLLLLLMTKLMTFRHSPIKEDSSTEEEEFLFFVVTTVLSSLGKREKSCRSLGVFAVGVNQSPHSLLVRDFPQIEREEHE